jgi:hypothetical protein
MFVFLEQEVFCTSRKWLECMSVHLAKHHSSHILLIVCDAFNHVGLYQAAKRPSLPQ